jgi:transcriptional regulator with XRE-family HTH domain
MDEKKKGDHEMNQENALGTLVRTHRINAGLSLREAQELTGINRGTLHKIEHGDIERPGPQVLKQLARAYGTDVEDYVSLSGYSLALPNLSPYLRTKYGASAETAAQVDAYFRFLQQGGTDTPPTSNEGTHDAA